ncbi:uncharacterized protein LOC109834848 isoform X2 [Asparagus officinalis]|uniref:uncharacterized protein LOC109834848 isoform X2 n=1 Tax=Asparagus officinalis TaxID=4686 RepID=UPI00098E41EA|nr:uncharacterized protein LOC109834848 isoform X2 [Asparagus officinalis]
MALCASLKLTSSSPLSPPNQGHGKLRDAVYVASVPLRAARGPPQLLMSAAYSLGLWDLQHFMVIIKPAQSQSKAVVFDFQPQDPENIYLVLAALSGRRMPGVIMKRLLSRLPRKRCWFIGFSQADGVEMARKFTEDWSTDLIVGKHDCRHYTTVQSLTGEQNVLDSLRGILRKEFIL